MRSLSSPTLIHSFACANGNWLPTSCILLSKSSQWVVISDIRARLIGANLGWNSASHDMVVNWSNSPSSPGCIWTWEGHFAPVTGLQSAATRVLAEQLGGTEQIKGSQTSPWSQFCRKMRILDFFKSTILHFADSHSIQLYLQWGWVLKHYSFIRF